MEKLCKTYLEGLNKGDLDQVLSLFTDDGMVHSPLYGTMSARDFYTELFEDTTESKTTHLNTFTSAADSVALHFRYVWILANGKEVEFECVDVFKVSPTKDQFTELKIIYDTYPIRSTHAESKRN